MKKLILCGALLSIVALSCQKDSGSEVINQDTNEPVSNGVISLPAAPYNYADITLPNYYTNGPVNAADNTPNDNPVTNEGATLGRVLFYDKNLSANATVSCASCHQQDKGFSDPLVFSDGFEGGKTGRHSMSLANSRYYNNGNFFWDERANTLEEQVLMPIQDQVEMGMTLDSLIARLSTLDYYDELFTDAFGDATVTNDRISSALAQFVRSMVSYRTKYDVGRIQVQNANQPFPNFTTQENLGKQLFLSPQLACGACHGTDAFIAPGARNNGLDAVLTDNGVGDVSNNARDNGRFKVGSLRNIALTAPYMHDGRFATLQEVVEHYNSGVQAHPNLDPPLRLQNGQVRRLNLDQNEKDALIAFFNTLTDNEMATDEKFSDPFDL